VNASTSMVPGAPLSQRRSATVRQARRLLKTAGRVAAAGSILHHAAGYALAAGVLGRERAFAGAAQRASRWAGLWGSYRRRALLRLIGVRLAKDCHIEFGTLFSKPTAVVASGVYIGAYCCLGNVRIGGNTMLADGVHVPSGRAQHGSARLDIPMVDQPGRLETVSIGTDCWIGSGAVVLGDVGDHAIVAAGAVVTQPVPAWAVVAGVPAKAVGSRSPAVESSRSNK